MPPPFLRHVFVCTNRRQPGHRMGSCAEKGSEALREELKREVGRCGLSKEVRVSSAGCLDACAFGAAVVVYPEGAWYGGVSAADVPELVKEHLAGGRPVERLRMKLP